MRPVPAMMVQARRYPPPGSGSSLSARARRGRNPREPRLERIPDRETAFFQVADHFVRMAEKAREIGRHRVPVRVWCSACASGEEAYSAAMALREAGCAAEIVGTDVDADALAAAKRAIYPLGAVQGLGEERLRRHFFVRGASGTEALALVRSEVRAMVRFSEFDLLVPDWPALETFDFVFCHNVLHHLDAQAQQKLLSGFVSVLAPGGMLFADAPGGAALAHPAFVPCGKGAYERR